MEFPKTIKKRINGINVTIQPYLPTVVIDGILEAVISVNDYALRTTMADAMVLAQCTDLADFHTEDGNVDINTVDVYRANGIIDAITREIRGYEILLAGLADLSIRDVTKRFEDAITEFTNEFKNIDLEGQQKKFEETLGELHKAEAEKEAVLNG